MNKIALVLVCLISILSVNASHMGRLYYAISEAVVLEFDSGLSIEQTENAFDSVSLAISSKQINGCDIVYKGSVLIKEEKVFYDVCVDINEDRTFDITVSERQAND